MDYGKDLDSFTFEKLLKLFNYPNKIAEAIASVPAEWILGANTGHKYLGIIDELTIQELTGLNYWESRPPAEVEESISIG